MTLIMCDLSETTCRSARADGEDLWVSPGELEAATGWVVKTEGLCKGEVCVPIASGKAAHLAHEGAINVAGFWRHLGHPVAHDDAGGTWVLGSSAVDRAAALQSLEAPDFVLPNLAGHRVALSQYRGKKVLLATWASW
jgi:AhpC/TSA family